MTGLSDLPPPGPDAPEGYYPDPLGGPYGRWWDGERWAARVGPEMEPPPPGERPAPGEPTLPQAPPPQDAADAPKPIQPGAPISAAFRLYAKYPLLFLGLAAGVIVPYDLIVLALTGAGPVTRDEGSVTAQIAVGLLDWILIAPLVSALHVHAVDAARGGETPSFGPVFRKGLAVLPVVVAATIMSGLGIALGLLALIVPGVILLLRWAVVAQAAAIEDGGWIEALRRSADLASGSYGRIFVFVLLTGFIVGIPVTAVASLFATTEGTTAASVLVGLPVRLLAASFGALCTAFLYYALRARLDPSEEPIDRPL